MGMLTGNAHNGDGYADIWSRSCLAGKVAVVTGASGGIGREVTRALAAAGGRVFSLSRRPDRPEDLVDGVHHIRADAGDEGQVRAAIDEISDTAGRIDIVVANAARYGSGEFATVSTDEWRREFEVNVTGVFVLFQASLARMIPAGAGSLIAVGSTAGGRGGGHGHVAYGATKAALVGLVKGLAREVGGYGVRVNVMAPGAIAGTGMSDLVKGDQGERFGKGAFLGRAGTVEEVGNAIVFLASEASSYVTGSVLRVDGGSLYRDGK